MVREAAGRLVHFEVHALRGTRWTIELALADGELAQERAQQILHRPEIDGVQVWKELHDPATGESAGRVILAEVKPKPKPRWRRRSRVPAAALDDQSAATSQPEPRRQPMAPPPRRADWPLAGFSIGGACAALVALAVLAARG
jgi:hypothetical protein